VEMNDSWTLPTTLAYKVNVAGAVFTRTGRFGARVVICDHEGRLAAAMR